MKTSSGDPLRWVDAELAELESRSLRRTLATHGGPQQAIVEVDGRELINFGSNDYLGLAADPRLAAAAAQAAIAEGTGAGASPLVTGHAQVHGQLEARLAEFEGTEAALLFGSGYAANQGTIAALAGRSDAIYADQGNHASMIDGCRLSRAQVFVYPHRDARALARLLLDGAAFRRRLIVTESIFSMDGDLAPLAELAELAERHDGMLLVDEAHATGVFGRRGRGLAEETGVEHRVSARVGTLSKALGSAGGFVCGEEKLVDWLVNRARPYIFSTAMSPPVAAAALAALDVVHDEPARRVRLLERAAALRRQLSEQGWSIGASQSQIIPLVAGDAATALAWAEQLRACGLLVPAIRPPSVPDGRALLRVSLTHAHTDEMIARLAGALDTLAAPLSNRARG
jgi:8-amino-7-oxononanoate synthase